MSRAKFNWKRASVWTLLCAVLIAIASWVIFGGSTAGAGLVFGILFGVSSYVFLFFRGWR